MRATCFGIPPVADGGDKMANVSMSRRELEHVKIVSNGLDYAQQACLTDTPCTTPTRLTHGTPPPLYPVTLRGRHRNDFPTGAVLSPQNRRFLRRLAMIMHLVSLLIPASLHFGRGLR